MAQRLTPVPAAPLDPGRALREAAASLAPPRPTAAQVEARKRERARRASAATQPMPAAEDPEIIIETLGARPPQRLLPPTLDASGVHRRPAVETLSLTGTDPRRER